MFSSATNSNPPASTCSSKPASNSTTGPAWQGRPRLQEALQAADGMIVRSGTRVTAELLEKPGKLRAIVRAGVGVDNIDVAAATRRGIVVMNTPGGNTVSTAEHTITMLMALARHIPAADASLRAGKWERGKFVGTQLAGKTLGVIGLGRVGREVARRAAGLDMKVIGFDPFLAPDRAAQLGIETRRRTSSQLLPRCDFLTVHTPGGAGDHEPHRRRRLALMKRGARIINCARGGIINEEALAEALQSGHIAGAALDVFVQEPPPADHPLTEAAQRRGDAAPGGLDARSPGRGGPGSRPAADRLICSAASCSSRSTWPPSTAPSWRNCGFTSTWPAGLDCCTPRWRRARSTGPKLSYRGEVARRSTKLITAAFAAGLLESRLAQDVNIVNAELLARERGIEIVEQLSPKKGDFSTLDARRGIHRPRKATSRPARCLATSICAWSSSGRSISTPSWTASW